ncbi:DUF2971 domain-containing protein [Mariniplasma anaerobium]|uniref:DUF2971 domain-containing protein n=1 Tax=Mariniplasma anaerobium TaxID=2735436 RepID=A0A7U9THR0_9MOLU|nr:DUF2971 domain-containing protein [Mariniplasma anaerobium]BCR36680.1 hypothetical protein MPAN_015730 [Mariniplasma anaerobium]
MNTLYKYTSIENAKKSLEGGYIYLSSPENFNDIYDSSFGFNLDEMKKVIIGEIASRSKIGDKSYIDLAKNVKAFSNKKTDTAEDRYDFIDLFLSNDYFKILEKFGRTNQSELFDELLLKSTEVIGSEPTPDDLEVIDRMKKFDYNELLLKIINDNKDGVEHLKQLINGFIFKIGCLSEIHTSNYMWALYANNFKGVCLEYDYKILKKEVKGDLYKISYSVNRPIIQRESILTFIDDQAKGEKLLEEEILKTLTTKHIEFINEREWRIIKLDSDNNFATKSIKKIFLGHRLSNPDILIFKNYAKKYKIDLYQLICKDDTYTIEFSKIDII